MLYEGVQIDTAQKAESQTIPAPVGGLNGRDSLAAMAEKDAYEMDNIFPGTATCKVRSGCDVHVAGLGHPVYSLEVFGGDTGDHILAIGGGKVQNVTNPAAIVTLKADLAGRETVALMFSTVADNNQFLLVTMEGTDAAFKYDGVACTDLVFTGMDSPADELNFVSSYQGRVFWGAKERLGFYYLPPGQIQGAMEWFDLGQICHHGGVLIGMATYSEDAGDGPADYMVFITNHGEYVMYVGNDPGDPTGWEIVGRYKSAPPVGRKCLIDYAGDLVVLTLEGALQFSQIRKLADTRFELEALSSKLGDTLLSHNVFKDVYGWCMALYPVGGWLLVSVPHSFQDGGMHHHFVMNTTTQAWARYYGDEWNGLCWVVADNKLYFGRADGSVRQADVGDYDNDHPIRYSSKQAYSYFGTPAYKHFKWAQFLIKSEAPAAISAQLSVDYKEQTPNPVTSTLDPGPGAVWDISPWDTDYWAPGAYTQRFIQPFGQYGVVGSHWLNGLIAGATLEWFATEHVFEKATGLLG